MYKFLQSQTDQLNQIIISKKLSNIDGGKIKSLDALERKKFINLTDLQLSIFLVMKATIKFRIYVRFLIYMHLLYRTLI